MKINKLNWIYKNIICKKYYLLAFIYLFLIFSLVYFNINVSYFLFLFILENINTLELSLFFILNSLFIIFYQYILNKFLIKSRYLYILTCFFTIPLCYAYTILFKDILFYLYCLIIDNHSIITSYILKFI